MDPRALAPVPFRTVEVPADPAVGLRKPLRIDLAPGCTTLVGPNATGKGPALAALARIVGRDGIVVRADSATTPLALVERAVEVAPDVLGELADVVLAEVQHVMPEVARIEVDPSAGVAEACDRFDVPVGVAAGLRASWALGITRALVAHGEPVVALVLEEPGAFLHPAAQEALRGRLSAVVAELGLPVVLSAESPFTVPRGASDAVVALGRDVEGATVVLDRVAGDDPQAGLVGGLFRDPGLGAVLDRAARLVPGTRAIVVFEGGTDEAYLRLAADVLGRAAELTELAIVPAGGASAAALQAVVLRAETDLPVLVVLDNDEPGRHARDTLSKRLAFARRREVTTYAEVLPGYPLFAEAEDLFAWRFVARFVKEMGPEATKGQQILYQDAWHYDLTTQAKSAFVGWARANATPEDVWGWALLLDILAERLAPASGDVTA